MPEGALRRLQPRKLCLAHMPHATQELEALAAEHPNFKARAPCVLLGRVSVAHCSHRSCITPLTALLASGPTALASLPPRWCASSSVKPVPCADCGSTLQMEANLPPPGKNTLVRACISRSLAAHGLTRWRAGDGLRPAADDQVCLQARFCQARLCRGCLAHMVAARFAREIQCREGAQRTAVESRVGRECAQSGQSRAAPGLHLHAC